MASHAKEAEVYNGVSTDDVPSAAWGWSEIPRSALLLSGVIGGLFLLGMLFGNHVGNVENYVLVVLAVLTLGGTLLVFTGFPGKQVTTVTARNKPADYVAPNWAADQHNLTGEYATLTDDEKRALNIDVDATR